MTFEPPAGWTRVETIDAHTAGEPLRVITGGLPEPEGDTMLAKRRFARARLDPLRRALMLEPRGHADMYGALPTRPVSGDGHVGVLFLHNQGWSTMCGHGIIGLVKVGLEAGLFAADGDEVRIDTPAGRVTATAHRDGDRVRAVSFLNVPSFVLQCDFEVDVEGLGRARGDLAFGGAFYAYVDADELGLELVPRELARIVDAGVRIERAVADSLEIVHPSGEADLGSLYGTILVGRSERVHSRHVCVFAGGQVDRSPTGTGVSGRAAILRARGELGDGAITIESLIGTTFDVRVAGETRVGHTPAVVAEVTGTAHVTGRHEFLIDPGDPLAEGVLLR